MGAAWNAQDPHAGHGYAPKLIVAGRLDGTVDGRPVVIQADESGLLVAIPAVTTAWVARQSAGALVPLLQSLGRLGIPLRVRVAGFVTIGVLPTPSATARILVPALTRIA